MGIDGIGRPTTPPQLDATIALEQAEPKSCEVSNVTFAAPSAITQNEELASSSNILSRYNLGEITREQYLDLRVEEALSPFKGNLSPDQFDFIRTTLREQLDIDPTLIELTRRATENASSR